MFNLLFSINRHLRKAVAVRSPAACVLLATMSIKASWATELEINQSVVRVPEQAVLSQLGQVIDQQADLSQAQLSQKLTLESISKQWLTRSRLSQILSQQLDQPIAVTGVDKVWIEVCKTLDMDLVKQRLTNALQQSYSAEYARITGVKNLTRAFCLPADVRHIKVNEKHVLKPRQQVTVSMVTGKQTVLWLDVEIDLAVAKLKVAKAAKAAVTSTDVEWQWLSNNKVSSHKLYDTEQTLPARLFSKKALPSGTLITTQNTFIKPLVGRGETVKVIYQTGAVKVEYTGTALSNANQGEPVKIMFERARKPVLGNVISEGVVGV